MTPYAITALALAALLAGAAVHCIRRAAHHLRAIQRDSAANFGAHCDELLAIVHDAQPGRDENARELLEEMYRRPAVARRNTQPRKEEL